jgi:uncharacterized membrane protein
VTVSQTPPDPQSPADPPPAGAAGLSADGSWASRHPVAAYTTARLLLFVVPFGLLLFVADFFTALLLAFLFSAIVSIFALRKQRDAMSASIATRAERANQKMAERSAVEDEWDDAQRDPTDGSDRHAG